MKGERSILSQPNKYETTGKESRDVQLFHRNRQPLQPCIHFFPLSGTRVFFRKKDVKLSIIRINDINRLQSCLPFPFIASRSHTHLDDARCISLSRLRTERITRPEEDACFPLKGMQGSVNCLHKDEIE